MSCPFCNSADAVSTAYPSNRFNNKHFSYVRCMSCSLVYLNNFPDDGDYAVMYPPSYQGNKAVLNIQTDPYKKLPGLRFSYGFQFDLIRKQSGAKSKILDYGCGTGHFIANAIHHGFQCDGAEFNQDYVSALQSGMPSARFYVIDQLLAGGITEKYDVIRLSNVLEHLTDPAGILHVLKNNLAQGGIILIEGPVEENFCFATAFRKLYFRIGRILKPGRVISSPPYHIFFSNRINQRNFFQEAGFSETHFYIAEDAWPFPSSFRMAHGIKEKMMALVAKTSIFLSGLCNKNWGNTFIYTGKRVSEGTK
jgi:SAM-dependent methyltransferase